MVGAGVQPSIVTYTSLARPFARQGNLAAVEDILRMMTEQGVKMNEYFLNVILVACSSSRPRQAKKAEELFRRALSEGVALNEYITTSLEKVLGRERAQALLVETGVSGRVQPVGNDGIKKFRRQEPRPARPEA